MKTFVYILLAALFSLVSSTTSNEESSEYFLISRIFDAYRDTRFLLSTRRNRGNPQQIFFRNLNSIHSSPYDPTKPTRILIHGWWEDDTAAISVATSEELLNYYDFNVIFIDWSKGSQTINYFGAVGRVEAVGYLVASQLNWMRENGLIDFDHTYVIGFSLGAHIAGFVGKNTYGELDTIIGLDPAGPLFSERRPERRISATDAKYVECLHTNGGFMGVGIGTAICGADFFANNGSNMPGCFLNVCSHNRAVAFYVESIIDNAFHSNRCLTEREAIRENCRFGGGFWFGGEPSNSRYKLNGIFNFATNRYAPFAKGPFRP